MSGNSDFHILTAIIFALFTLVFAIIHFSFKRQEFSGWVAFAYVAALLAYLLDALREPTTWIGFIFVSTMMFWIFCTAIAKAIYARCNANFPNIWAGLVLVTATASWLWLTFVSPDITTRSVVVNVAAGLLLSLALLPLWRTGTKFIDGTLFGVVGAVAATFIARVVIVYIVLGETITEQSYGQSTYVWIFQLTNGIAALALAVVLLYAAGHEMILYFHKQSSRDPLTGLLNRRGLSGSFNARPVGEQGAVFVRAIILFDIDHFKRVNDEFGHAAGDNVLRRVAKTALELCQEYGQVARTGGEEFAILTHWIPAETAQFLAQHICDSLRFVAHPELGTKRKVTASFGLAVLTDIDSLDDAMDRADKALYHAKRNGRNQVALAKAA
jgi:diguanylate cyclase (GGDEF)-like protein